MYSVERIVEECHLGRYGARNNVADARETYDAMAADYVAHVEASPFTALYEAPGLRALVPPVAGRRVLDAGCGAGRTAAFDAGVRRSWITRHRRARSRVDRGSCRRTPAHMGAKDWMVFHAERDVPSVLAERPTLDREATVRVVERLFPRHTTTALDDVTLAQGNPPDDEVYAAVWPGATVVCSGELGIDRPSTLDRRFIEAGAGRTIYLHAMHSVVDWFAFAVWTPDGQLSRALSLSPDSGILENVGDPLPFEEPFWAGDRPAVDPEDEDDEEPYPFAFDPLELGEEALGTLFGFVYEGPPSLGTVDPEDITLAAFALKARRRGLFGRR